MKKFTFFLSIFVILCLTISVSAQYKNFSVTISRSLSPTNIFSKMQDNMQRYNSKIINYMKLNPNNIKDFSWPDLKSYSMILRFNGGRKDEYNGAGVEYFFGISYADGSAITNKYYKDIGTIDSPINYGDGSVYWKNQISMSTHSVGVRFFMPSVWNFSTFFGLQANSNYVKFDVDVKLSKPNLYEEDYIAAQPVVFERSSYGLTLLGGFDYYPPFIGEYVGLNCTVGHTWSSDVKGWRYTELIEKDEELRFPFSGWKSQLGLNFNITDNSEKAAEFIGKGYLAGLTCRVLYELGKQASECKCSFKETAIGLGIISVFGVTAGIISDWMDEREEKKNFYRYDEY